MPRLKFSREFSHPLDDTGRRKTWPTEWEGHVEDETVAAKAVKEGAAVVVGTASPARKPVAATEIPAEWEQLKAADMVELARTLGAGEEIATKAAAEKFIADVVTARAAQ